MDRFSAAAQVAAFFLLIASPLAQACEDCEPVSRDRQPTGRVDVTAAVDAATAELPGFRHRYAWQLTYRDDDPAVLSQPTPAERIHGMDVTLDDSWVLGLRFELDYGWKR